MNLYNEAQRVVSCKAMCHVFYLRVSQKARNNCVTMSICVPEAFFFFYLEEYIKMTF